MKNFILLFKNVNLVIKTFILAAFFLFVAGINKSLATTYVWGSTTTGGPWVTCTNWTGSACPVSSSSNSVTFNPSSSITINNAAPASTFTLGTFLAGSSNSGTTTIGFSTACTFTITTLNLTDGNLTLGGGGASVNMTVAGGTIASGKTLTIGSSCNLTISSGTFTVNGTISNSGTITVSNGATLLFSGSSFPSGITVAVGGTLLFTGSTTVTGGSATVNGTLNLGGGVGSTGTGSGFLVTWGSASTLIYQGNSQQTANYYELPSSSGPTNLTINNSSGVIFNGSLQPTFTLAGTLTLTAGALNMNGGYATITFVTSATPIARTSGTLVVGTTNAIIFGTSSIPGGTAFTIPNGTFGTANVGGIQIYRTNPITLPTDNITLVGNTTPYALNLLSGALVLNTSASTTLTISGTLPSSMTGTITGSATSNLSITGSGALGGPLKFTSGGQNLDNLTINRSSGTDSLGSALTVVTLAINNGLLSLGTSDLTISTSGGAATTTGSFSASTMVVTNAGSGFLNYTYASGASSPVYPIGSSTTTTTYNGFTLTVASNTVASRTVGFKVVGATAESTTPTDYIKRYFGMKASSTSATFTWSANMPYFAGDVVGTEANMFPAYSTTTTLSNFAGIGTSGAVNTSTHNLIIAGGSATQLNTTLTYITGMDNYCSSSPNIYALYDTLVNNASTPVAIGGYIYTESATSLTGFEIFATTTNSTAIPVNGTSYGLGGTTSAGAICVYKGLPTSHSYTTYIRYPWGNSSTTLAANTFYWLWGFSYDSTGTCSITYVGTSGQGSPGSQSSFAPGFQFSSVTAGASCSSAGTATITLTGSPTTYGIPWANGAPNQYNVIWSSAATTAGLVNSPSNAACGSNFQNFATTGGTFDAATFTVTIPANVTPGTYTGYVDPYNSTTGFDNCNSTNGGTGNDPTFTLTVTAALTGSVNVGTGYTYPTLTGAGGLFSAINSGGLSGNVVANVQTNTSEPGTNALNAFTYPCGGGPYSLTIQPAAAVTDTISGSVATNPMIPIGNPTVSAAGAKNVTINGNYNGSGQYLLFNNTYSNPASTGPTIGYIDILGANDTIKNCIIESNETNTSSGAIAIGSISGSATSAIVVSGNDIRSATFGTTGVYANGFYNNGANSYGFTISNNNFYQTSTLVSTVAQSAISQIGGTSSNSNVISGNYIGGSSAHCGGSPWTNNATGANSFQGINLSVGTTTITTIDGNVIQNIYVENSGTSGFKGINATGGSYVEIGATSGNTIGSTSSATSIQLAGTSATYGINLISSSNNLITLSNNVIAGFTTTGATAFTGIAIGANGGSSASGSVQGNTIQGITMSNAVASTFTGINIAAGVENIGNLTPNTIGNSSNIITYAGTSTCYGIYSTTGSSSGTSNLKNNVVSYISATGTSATTQLVGIYNSSATFAPVTLSGNTVKYLTSAAANAGTGSNAAVIGVSYTAATTYLQTVSNNIIHTLTNSNTGAVAINAIGVYYNQSTTPTGTNVINANLIHSISLASTSTSGSVITGLYIAGGAFNCTNNMIRLGIDSGGNAINNGYYIYGINEAAASSPDNYYFNSVYIGGSGVTSYDNTYAFNSAVTSGTRAIEDNIFYNARSNSSGSGSNYAIAIGAATGLTCNYNDLLANGTGAVLGYNAATATNYTTFSGSSGWQTGTSLDPNSINADPLFVNPTGTNTTVSLDIQTCSLTPIESPGILVAAVTTDFHGNSRALFNPTELGADAGNFILPAAAVSGGGTVCSGATLPNVSIALTGTKPWSLTYAIGGVNQTPVTGITSSPYVITHAGAGIYTVTALTDINCTGTSFTGSATVTVNTLPTASVSGGGTVCSGSTLPNDSIALTGTAPWNITYVDGIGDTTTVTGTTTNPYIIANAAGGTTYTVIALSDANCTGTSLTGSATVTVINCGFPFTVNFFIQGFYIGGGNMSPLLYLLGRSGNATDVDTVTIQLCNSTSPYAVAYTDTAILQSNGTVSCTFPTGASGNSYFIVLNHRNSLQTWSSSAQTVSSGGSYNFANAATQAFGSNMVNLGAGVYGIYSGDIYHDGAINGSDMFSLQAVLSTFKIGVYNVNDITGDGFVDEDDYRILENNIPLAITVQQPY